MRQLLDTQALIWYVDQAHLLSPAARAAIDNPANELLFDRLLAAQSIVEAAPLISIDGIFDSYGVQRIWN